MTTQPITDASTQFSSFQEASNPPIIIVGGGVAGLPMAIGAARKGYKVVLITKYPYAILTQRILLNANSSEFKLLKKLNDGSDQDKKFFSTLEKNHGTVSLGSLTRFLQRKLAAEMKTNPNITLIDETKGELTAVDLTKNTVTVALEERPNSATDAEKKPAMRAEVNLPFKSLIDASGAHRIAARKAAETELNNANEKTQGKEKLPQTDAEKLAAETQLQDIYQEKLTVQRPHIAQGTAIFHLKLGENDQLTPAQKITRKNIKSVNVLWFDKKETRFLTDHFSWEKSYPPKIYVIANAQRTKFYVGGEIPSYITDKSNGLSPAERKAKVEQWYKYMLSRAGIPTDQLTIAQSEERIEKRKAGLKKKGFSETSAENISNKKNTLGVTYFNMEMTRAKDPIRDVSKPDEPANTRMFLTVGDANQTADYHYAYGAQHALRAADEFLAALPENKKNPPFNAAKFSKFTNKIRAENEELMQSTKYLYQFREAIYGAHPHIRHYSSVKQPIDHKSTRMAYHSPNEPKPKSLEESKPLQNEDKLTGNNWQQTLNKGLIKAKALLGVAIEFLFKFAQSLPFFSDKTKNKMQATAETIRTESNPKKIEKHTQSEKKPIQTSFIKAKKPGQEENTKHIIISLHRKNGSTHTSPDQNSAQNTSTNLHLPPQQAAGNIKYHTQKTSTDRKEPNSASKEQPVAPKRS
jgi:2-polyprenyl-6-methoxyphenol hydroxylase-like FAD-dependent oxidoreductase